MDIPRCGAKEKVPRDPNFSAVKPSPLYQRERARDEREKLAKASLSTRLGSIFLALARSISLSIPPESKIQFKRSTILELRSPESSTESSCRKRLLFGTRGSTQRFTQSSPYQKFIALGFCSLRGSRGNTKHSGTLNNRVRMCIALLYQALHIYRDEISRSKMPPRHFPIAVQLISEKY